MPSQYHCHAAVQRHASSPIIFPTPCYNLYHASRLR
jgi:hypothetical protein